MGGRNTLLPFKFPSDSRDTYTSSSSVWSTYDVGEIVRLACQNPDRATRVMELLTASSVPS